MKTVTHKYLKRQFEIFDETDDFTNLFAELQFSTLLLPQVSEGNAFPVFHVEDKRYAPVFTDVYEYENMGFDDLFTLTPHEFDFYINLLDGDIDGIIINPEGENFPLFKEMKMFISTINRNQDKNKLTMAEIKKIRESINNTELNEFLNDESNHWDYESLLNILNNSVLISVVLSRDDLSNDADGGVISLENTGNLPSALTSNFTENYALLYIGESEVIPKNSPMHPYLQLVNLPDFIESVLLNDLDGIVLNENSQNIHIPRKYLIDFINNLQTANQYSYDDYAFVLEH